MSFNFFTPKITTFKMCETKPFCSGTQFPLEAQLIHFKEAHGSMERALDEPDGVAILVALFQARKSLIYSVIINNFQELLKLLSVCFSDVR